MAGSQFISFKGTAICKEGSALVFLGVPGSGKTCTAYRFLKNGYDFISDSTFSLKFKEEIIVNSLADQFVYFRSPVIYPELEHEFKLTEAYHPYLNEIRLTVPGQELSTLEMGSALLSVILLPTLTNGVQSSLYKIGKSELKASLHKIWQQVIFGSQSINDQEFVDLLPDSILIYRFNIGQDWKDFVNKFDNLYTLIETYRRADQMLSETK